VRRFPGQIHAFFTMGRLIADSDAAVEEVALAIRGRLAPR